MIFWRAKELIEGGSELFRAEAELMSKRFRRLLIGSLFFVVFGLSALIGITLITTGVLIALSDPLGWGASFAIVGGFYLLVGLLIYAIISVRSNINEATEIVAESTETIESPETPKELAQDAKDRLENAASPDPENAPEDKDSLFEGLDELKENAIEIGMKNPVALGSAALLVVSLLGPGKTFRIISRGVAAAGLASTLIENITPDEESKNKSERTT
ncbi:MAG: phage holin family protein [Phycisphaerales bacterium]|nr:phage holin family protein [Phycisphaerales bacterium]